MHHEHWDVLVEGKIVLLKCAIDRFRISRDSSILDGLSLFTERVNVFIGKLFEFSEDFLLGRLVEDEVFEELEVLL